jgi:aspartate-semialdehyde dehydrogenase
MHGLDSDEEVKVVQETRRVLGLPDLRISVTTVRVPVAVGHSGAVWAEFDTPADLDRARELLRTAPGVRVVDDPEHQRYPTPRDAAGTDDVWVGRLRTDPGNPGGLVLFWSADNLRKGAATNAVQVGELVLARRRARAVA